MNLHRNSQKRIYIPGAAYFITVKTLHNFRYFEDSVFCELFVENLRVCKRLKEFELYGWFLGYDHFHLLIRPMGKWNYSEIIHCLKRNLSRDINKIAPVPEGEDPNPRLGLGIAPVVPVGELTTAIGEHGDVRLRGLGVAKKFAIEIRQLELGVLRARICFLIKYGHRNPFPQFRWQTSFYDHYCRDKSDLRNHMEYIIRNPTKHKMPEYWPYVSTNPKLGDLIDLI